MKKFQYLKFLTLILGFVTGVANASDYETCKHAAAVANRALPMKKDNFTTAKSAICIPNPSKNVFVYTFEISIPIHMAKKIDFEEIKNSVKNTFCTDPKTRALIDAFDIDHRYYVEDGSFAGSFMMKSSECSQTEKKTKEASGLDLYSRSLENKNHRYEKQRWNKCAIEIENRLQSSCFARSNSAAHCKPENLETEILKTENIDTGSRHTLLTQDRTNNLRYMHACDVSKRENIIEVRRLN